MNEFYKKDFIKWKNISYKLVNRYDIPRTHVKTRAEFNELYKMVADLPKIGLSRSKGIKLRDIPFFGIWSHIHATNYNYEFIVVTPTRSCKIVYRADKDDRDYIPGRIAYRELLKEMKKDGIDLEKKYGTPKGKYFKELAPKPLIKALVKVGEKYTYENCHHLDIHSAYPAAIAETYPDTRKTWERLYEARHKKSIYKRILNLSIGCMGSQVTKYKLAKLYLCARRITNQKVKNMEKEIIEHGGKVILLNTDGIWWQGKPFKSKMIKDELGYFSLDHQNCMLRIKSAGAYEYIENGTYTPVVRGYTNLDKKKERKDWKWGDIFRAGDPLMVQWKENQGIIEVNEKGE